jgi:hypothetical protein
MAVPAHHVADAPTRATHAVQASLRRTPVAVHLAPSLSLQQQLFDLGLRIAAGWQPTVANLRSVYGLSRSSAYRRLAEIRAIAPDAEPRREVVGLNFAARTAPTPSFPGISARSRGR